jgi:hypothetical protein
MNEENKKYEIEIDEERNIYTSEIYDITIIEIREEDNIKLDSYFEIDDNKNELDYNYINKSIYLLNYQKGNKIHYSKGTIKNVNENNHEIEYLCDGGYGSSGGPIINAEDCKVIGIHKSESKIYNCGSLLKGAIIEFKNQIKNKDNIIKVIKIKENNKNEMKDNTNKLTDNNNKEKDIEKNNNAKIEKNKINELMDKNKKDEDNIDEITIKYKIEDIKDKKKIRIFGDEFVKNNVNICKIIIKENEYDLTTHKVVNKEELINDIYEIKLKGIKNINNMSHMFAGDKNDYAPLSSFPDISK